MTIKPIDTTYRGHLFRSRLEARWAVFFDQLGVPWEYEAQGYELEDGTKYLPDFYLPNEGTFIEVKGVHPDEDELKKAAMLAYGTKKYVNIVAGSPIGDHRTIAVRSKAPMPAGVGEWLATAPEGIHPRWLAWLLEDRHAVTEDIFVDGELIISNDGIAAKYAYISEVWLDYSPEHGRLRVWRDSWGTDPGDLVQGVDNRYHPRPNAPATRSWSYSTMGVTYESHGQYDYGAFRESVGVHESGLGQTAEYANAITVARMKRFEHGAS